MIITLLTSCSCEEPPKENQMEDFHIVRGELSTGFNSIDELKNGLLNDFTEDRLSNIENEERFRAFLEKCLKENRLMIPCYKGTEMPIEDFGKDFASITIHYYEAFSRPWIFYGGLFGNDSVSVGTMYIDNDLIDESNEKGVNWLIKTLSLGTNTYACPNLDNYKDCDFIEAFYESEIQLDGTTVIALIRKDNDEERLWVDFVYDDILVSIRIYPDAFERDILKDLSFESVKLK